VDGGRLWGITMSKGREPGSVVLQVPGVMWWGGKWRQ
jgi:hypothetical protein